MSRFVISLGMALSVITAAPASAAPCTSDYWQPTFVHDLESEDGPWYVTSGLTFIKLRWEQVGGYVPHACELVRGPQDTRDQRGFTTCQDYTRIQCGCSRNIPGNRTCAAFLQFHVAAITPQPAPPTTGPGGLFAPPASPGGMAVPPTGPGTLMPPTPSTTTTAVPATGFQRANGYAGQALAQGNDVVLRGGAWTNGRIKNGVQDGNRVYSTLRYDFANGGDAYMRVVVDGGGKYLAFWPRVLEGVGIKTMSTHHSWAGSIVVKDRETIFAHVRVEPGGSYRIAISTGGYDDQGGRVINSGAGRLTNLQPRLDLQFGDNYASKSASLVIGEALVRTGAGLAPSAQPQSSAPARGSGQSGAPCSRDADCASSMCLLGVCAGR